MDKSIANRNRRHGKGTRAVAALERDVAMQVEPADIRKGLATLHSHCLYIEEQHYDYYDRIEGSDKSVEEQKVERCTLETWYEGWQASVKACSTLCITYCESKEDAATITPSQARPLSVSGAGVVSTQGAEGAGTCCKTQHMYERRVPRMAVPHFEGNPRDWDFFITAFEDLIGQYETIPRIKLSQLLCHLRGEPLYALRNATIDKGERCYEAALDILRTRYGNVDVIAKSAYDALIGGKSCRTSADLWDFVNELQTTKTLVAPTIHNGVLDTHAVIDLLLIRLPPSVHARWNKYALKYKDTRKSYPGVTEFTTYLMTLAAEFNDKMYGQDVARARSDAALKRAGISGPPAPSKSAIQHVSSATCAVAPAPSSITALNDLSISRVSYDTMLTSTSVDLYEEGTHYGRLPSFSTMQVANIPPLTSPTEAVTMVSQQTRPYYEKQKMQNRSSGSKPVHGRTMTACPYCKGKLHDLVVCPAYRSTDYAGRWDQRMHQLRICHACLTLDCREWRTCMQKANHKCCMLKVHPLLHSPQCATVVKTMVSHIGASANVLVQAEKIVLPVVEVFLGSLRILAYLDNCSTHTFVSEYMVRLAALHILSEVATSSGSIHGTVESSSKITHFSLRAPGGHIVYNVKNAFVIPRLPAGRRAVACDVTDNPHLQGLPLALTDTPEEVHVLIGQDHSHLLVPLEVKMHPDFPDSKVSGRPYAVRTLLGWAIQGKLGGNSHKNREFVNMINSVENIEQNVQRLWDVERELDTGKTWSQEDRAVYAKWEGEVRVDETGHYEVPIPLKNPNANFPNNREFAVSRLESTTRNLKKKNALDKYTEQIDSMIEDKYVERVPRDMLGRDDGKVFYIPHFPVYHPDKPDKVRVVNDCKATYQGISVNNMCLQGPDLLNNLMYVLLRFRQHEYAWAADVSAMYFQVKIPVDQRDILRFLWYDQNGDVIDYRMTGHVMGGLWCSASSAFAIRTAVKDAGADEKVIRVIEKDLYVDDALHSDAVLSDAILTAHGCRDALRSSHFRFCKFVGTHPEILEGIPPEEHGVTIRSIEADPESKALGMRWNIKQDYFFYIRDSLTDFPEMTKRKLLSQVASLYDPLGLIAPIIVSGKLVFQEATRRSMDWDDVLPDAITKKWRAWYAGLQHLDRLHFPRCLLGQLYEGAELTLHTFADASEKSYGCVTYLRVVKPDEKIKVIIVMGKGRVAPNKALSMPRLELCAAKLATKQDYVIRSETTFTYLQSHFWSDSSVVLHYIRNPSLRLKAFVSNRVDYILERSDPAAWHHVRTDVNPADIVSRGCDVAHELPGLWMHGPEFLRRPEEDWPKELEIKTAVSLPLEVKTMLAVTGKVRAMKSVTSQRESAVPVALPLKAPQRGEGYVVSSGTGAIVYDPIYTQSAMMKSSLPLTRCYSGEHACLLTCTTSGEGRVAVIHQAACLTCSYGDVNTEDGNLATSGAAMEGTSGVPRYVTRSVTRRQRSISGGAAAGCRGEGQDITTPVVPVVTHEADRIYDFIPKNAQDSVMELDTDRKSEAAGSDSVGTGSKPHLNFLDPIGTLIRYYSNLTKLCTSLAWLKRLCRYARKEEVSGPLTAEEVRLAEDDAVRHVQRDVYASELEALRTRNRIPASSTIIKLRPMLLDGKLVVGGRLRHVSSLEVNRFPVILPRKHPLSLLICRRVHDIAHVGAEWSVARLRDDYWIVGCRQIFRHLRDTCVLCQRHFKLPASQLMADLPPERVSHGPVCFTSAGVDLFGPLLVKVGRAQAKRWGVIFTCMASRAIHLEVVASLGTDSFIMALMRFMARRGLPVTMFSDQGTNLIGAEAELNAAWRDVDVDALTHAARKKGIDWKFNPPKASNFGGAWERCIRTVKNCLNTVLRPTDTLDDETLYTALTEVEALVNSRPITRVSSDPEDGVLTPNHLLMMTSNTDYSASDLDLGAVYRRKWKAASSLRDSFWKQWTKQYLLDLQSRSKWEVERADFKVDDVVIMVEVGLKRGQWPLAVVTSVDLGRDGRVRSVRVKTRNSDFQRPINKLVKLELN